MVNSENFIIPKKINVGYQERSDCYTKKLGFITYTDFSTGILKKKNLGILGEIIKSKMMNLRMFRWKVL